MPGNLGTPDVDAEDDVVVDDLSLPELGRVFASIPVHGVTGGPQGMSPDGEWTNARRE